MYDEQVDNQLLAMQAVPFHIFISKRVIKSKLVQIFDP